MSTGVEAVHNVSRQAGAYAPAESADPAGQPSGRPAGLRRKGENMAVLYRKAMDALYLACVFIAGSALVLISAVIPWAVFTRYVINSASSWPEPTAVLLTIVLTFFGAAACYRLGLHMNVTLVVDLLPKRLRRFFHLIVGVLVGAECGVMVPQRAAPF